jgi:hypothetical protein
MAAILTHRGEAASLSRSERHSFANLCDRRLGVRQHFTIPF